VHYHEAPGRFFINTKGMNNRWLSRSKPFWCFWLVRYQRRRESAGNSCPPVVIKRSHHSKLEEDCSKLLMMHPEFKSANSLVETEIIRLSLDRILASWCQSETVQYNLSRVARSRAGTAIHARTSNFCQRRVWNRFKLVWYRFTILVETQKRSSNPQVTWYVEFASNNDSEGPPGDPDRDVQTVKAPKYQYAVVAKVSLDLMSCRIC
jgi:hypothetical protein